MRIMTRIQYDAICDIVTGQKKIIEEKETEIKRLKAQVKRLSYLLDAELAGDQKIDFHNSEVVYHEEDNNRLF